jgi:hypothetical protein
VTAEASVFPGSGWASRTVYEPADPLWSGIPVVDPESYPNYYLWRLAARGASGRVVMFPDVATFAAWTLGSKLPMGRNAHDIPLPPLPLKWHMRYRVPRDPDAVSVMLANSISNGRRRSLSAGSVDKH